MWALLLWGLLGIGVGILTFLAPGITALALLFYIAVWAVATGVLQIVVAIRLRKEIEGEWMLILAGLASVVFGVLLMAQPGAGALALLWLIGAYAVTPPARGRDPWQTAAVRPRPVAPRPSRRQAR